MSPLYSRFWIRVTIMLSVIFIALGFPAFRRAHGIGPSFLITLVGVCCIWITYIVRAYL